MYETEAVEAETGNVTVMDEVRALLAELVVWFPVAADGEDSTPIHEVTLNQFEIEITEAELKSAVERKVRTAVADQTNQWNVDSYIKEQVKKHWQGAVEALVLEMLADSPRMKEKIQAAIEAKLRGQITALMKVKK